MDKDFIGGIPPVDVKSEGRGFRRFGENADVLLKFSGNSVRGKLLNISIGGVLGLFHSSDPLPNISEKVTAGMDMDGRGNLFEVEGTVIRIRPERGLDSPEFIEIAVKFADQSPEKKHLIKNIVTALMRKTKALYYPSSE